MSDTIYTVVSGDTATKITKKFNISLDVFKKLNPTIKDVNKLSIGQKVKVGEEVVVEFYQEDTSFDYFDDTLMYYITPKGQTWFSLAKFTNLAQDEVAKINNLNPQSQLMESQVLQVPIPKVIIQVNDTLSEICKIRGVDYKNVATINGLESIDMIYEGQILELIEIFDEQLLCLDKENNPIIWQNYMINLDYGIRIGGITNEIGKTQRFYTNIPVNIISIDFLEGELNE